MEVLEEGLDVGLVVGRCITASLAYGVVVVVVRVVSETCNSGADVEESVCGCSLIESQSR